MEPSEFMTPEEAAELLKVHTNTIYNMIREGVLPAHRIGTGLKRPRYRIPRSAIADLVQDTNGQQEAQTDPSKVKNGSKE